MAVVRSRTPCPSRKTLQGMIVVVVVVIMIMKGAPRQAGTGEDDDGCE